MSNVRPCTPEELADVARFSAALAAYHDAQDRYVMARTQAERAKAEADMVAADDIIKQECKRIAK